MVDAVFITINRLFCPTSIDFPQYLNITTVTILTSLTTIHVPHLLHHCTVPMSM